MKSLKEIAKNMVLDEARLKKIEEIILNHGHYAKSTIRDEIDWFLTGLGMDPYYFKTTPLKTIANHIEAIKSAAIMASLQKKTALQIDLATEQRENPGERNTSVSIRSTDLSSVPMKSLPRRQTSKKSPAAFS
jgi:hypothetical protein